MLSAVLALAVWVVAGVGGRVAEPANKLRVSRQVFFTYPPRILFELRSDFL